MKNDLNFMTWYFLIFTVHLNGGGGESTTLIVHKLCKTNAMCFPDLTNA